MDNTLDFEAMMQQQIQQKEEGPIGQSVVDSDDKPLYIEKDGRLQLNSLDSLTENRTSVATEIESAFIRRMMDVDNYLWTRSEEGGLTTGFEQLDKALDHDISPGLYLIAGAPNTGKSAIMLQIARQIANLNENVHASYHALDDNISEILIRYIAGQARVTISQAKNPARYKDELDVIRRRNQGFKDLYDNSNKFTMWDGDNFTSVEAIEEHIKSLKMAYGESKQIILFIDSIFDLETSETFSSDKGVLEYVVKKVKSWSTTYNAAIFTTAHIRKNGNRRPTMEDLKESNRVAFEANFAMLLHNEVGINEEEASIYWLDAETEMKMPVLENKIGKNKFSSFKGTLYYEFMPDQSYLLEAEEEDRARYASMI